MSCLRHCRYFNPATIDTAVFSCLTCPKASSIKTGLLTCSVKLSSENQKFQINSVFINRNPRCLEQAAIAPKRQGWSLHYPTKNYYYKLIFEVTNRHITAEVEHNTDETIVSVSSKEWAIKQGLYSCTDVSAAKNIGRVLAERCLQCGINQIFYDEQPEDIKSEKIQVFLKALKDGQLILEEKDYIPDEFKPGLDYSKSNRYGEKKQWKDDYQIA